MLGHSDTSIKYIYARSVETNQRIVGHGVFTDTLTLSTPGGIGSSLPGQQGEAFVFRDFPYIPVYYGSVLDQCRVPSRNGEDRGCGDLTISKINEAKQSTRNVMESTRRYLLPDHKHTWFKIRSLNETGDCLYPEGPSSTLLSIGPCTNEENMWWMLDFGFSGAVRAAPIVSIISASERCIEQGHTGRLSLTSEPCSDNQFSIRAAFVPEREGTILIGTHSDSYWLVADCGEDAQLVSTSHAWPSQLHRCASGDKARSVVWSLTDKVVRRPPQPDLVGTIEGPVVIYPSQEVNIAFEVKNLGSASAARVEVETLLSRNEKWSDDRLEYSDTYHDDVLLLGGRFTNTAELKEGDSFETMFATMLPGDTPPGRYCVGLSIDGSDEVQEKNEENNKACHWIEVADRHGLPDLTANIRAPENLVPGQPLTEEDIAIEIINLGGSAPGNGGAGAYNVDLLLSQDYDLPNYNAQYSPQFMEDVLLGRWSLGAEPQSGGSIRLPFGSTPIPQDTPPGPYCLGVKVDPGHRIYENDRDNNEVCKWVNVSDSITLTSGEEISDKVRTGEWQWYRVATLAEDIGLNIEVYDLSDDVDLYVQEGYAPSAKDYNCRPYSGGTDPETCKLANSGESIWYIGVHGYYGGSYRLKVEVFNNGEYRTLSNLRASINGPYNVYLGEEFGPTLNIVIENGGQGQATGTLDDPSWGYMADVIISRDSILPMRIASFSPNFTEDVLLRGGRISRTRTLSAGEREVFSLQAGIPADTPPGRYCIGVVVDPGQRIIENREDNTSCHWVQIHPAKARELVSGVEVTGSVELGQWQYYAIDVTPRAATQLLVELFGLSSDVDLYVQRWSLPTMQNYRCRPSRGIDAEICILDFNGGGIWYIGVYGYSQGDFNLRATLQ
jgi:hypothetical protein